MTNMAYKDPEKKRAYQKRWRASRTPEQKEAHNLKARLRAEKYRGTRLDKGKQKAYMRTRHLKYNYGMTVDEHLEMYAAQKGCCAVCGKPIEYESVDTEHNHITGKVRGLTCHHCNTGLGMFFVDEKGVEILKQAIKYLGE